MSCRLNPGDIHVPSLAYSLAKANPRQISGCNFLKPSISKCGVKSIYGRPPIPLIIQIFSVKY